MKGIEIKGAKTLFRIGPVAITQTALSLLAVTLILCAAGALLGRDLKKKPGKMQVFTEKSVQMLTNLVVGTMGRHNVGWVPYIGTLFLSSLAGSLIGLTGFLRATTADLSVVLTWAVMTSVVIWYRSIKHNGVLGWLKGFTKPIFVMAPINIISEIAQPVAMAFRHFGNVAGGGIITTIVYTALSMASAALLRVLAKTVVLPAALLGLAILLVAWGCKKIKLAPKIVGGIFAVLGILGLAGYFNLLGGVEIPVLQLGLPAVLSVYFDLFSGFVQAFVFCLLSMVYIAAVCPPRKK